MARHIPSRPDVEEGSAPRSSLSDVLKRRGWGGVVAFLVVLVPLASLVYFLPDVYRSSTTVLIERQQIPDELVKSTVTGALEMRLQTIKEQMLSRASLTKVIRCNGLYGFAKKAEVCAENDLTKVLDIIPETVFDQMRQDVKIDLRGGDRRGDRSTVAFTISYRGPDRTIVADVADALAASYISENQDMRRDQAKGTANFLGKQLDTLKEHLSQLEGQVGVFKSKHMGHLPEQLDANLKTLEQLNTQLRLNSENMTRTTERRGNLERELASALGATTPTGPDSAAIRLAQLRGALASLQTRYSDKHPEVVRVKAEIANLESAPGGGGASGGGYGTLVPGPQVQQLKTALLEAEVQVKGLEAEAVNLKRQIATYQGRIESVPGVQQKYQALAREYETTQEMYKSLTLRERESALSERMEDVQKGEFFRVIEPARPSEEPAAPKRPRLFALVALLALAAAGAAIFGPEALDSSLHSLEQLQARCELPVLVAIPRIVGPADLNRQRKRFVLATAGMA
jgi:polysaccharide chain length determinant protein (PEP-CTERM system associated)